MSPDPYFQNYPHEDKLRSLLVSLAGLYKKADIYTLFSICNDLRVESFIRELVDLGFIEEYEVCVFNKDFICYGVTRDGYEYLKVRPYSNQS